MGLRPENLQALEKALSRRASFIKKSNSEKTNAYRLFSGEKEGIAGLVIDRLASVLIFQVHEGKAQFGEAELLEIGQYLMNVTGAQSVYRKIFVSDRSKKTASDEYYSAEPFLGEVAAETVEILENGLRFLVKPYDGYSTGIFLDQRENRLLLAEKARKKTVLNLFSYTCGFSVAAASQGARTTSVDLSKNYLDWGKRNFLQNEIDLKQHEFYAEDTFSFLKRCRKQGRVFDTVIVDPPSFSRSKKDGVFSLKKDFKKLLIAASEVVAPKGLLFFSCNFSEWDSAGLQRVVLNTLSGAKAERLPGAPVDFKMENAPLTQVLVRL